MEPERWQDVERIYHSALQCDGSQRSHFLEKACGEDQRLRVEVESLLKYAQRSEEVFEAPALEVVARSLAEDLRTQERQRADKMIGARIAQYRILDKLGEGGMGDVYRAVRADDEYEKQVAIKLVRQGLDTESGYERFRRERQILAGFEHENIARLLDGGTTDEGYPYFVMELVEGQPIDEYCDQGRLRSGRTDQSFPERLFRGAVRPPAFGGTPGYQARQYPGNRRRRSQVARFRYCNHSQRRSLFSRSRTHGDRAAHADPAVCQSRAASRRSDYHGK